jgi:hypothetical protein
MQSVRIVIILLIGITSQIFSQNTFEFLRVDMSPRAAALGGSFAASGDDADVIFYNPAGLKLLEEIPVSVSYLNHLLDINFASISISKKFNDFSTFGAAIKYANYGTFTKADDFGNRSGEYSANDIALIIGYAGEIDENFYYGANAKFIYSGIESYSSTAAAVDLGVYYVIPSEQLNFSFAIQNLGSQLSSYISTKENLPLDVNIGVAKKLSHLPLRLFIDFNRIQENSDGIVNRFKNFSIGGEFTLSKVFRLRAGYDNQKRKELKVGTFAGLAGFNIGLGVVIKEYIFNYAYSSMGQIGTLHRIGINTNL